MSDERIQKGRQLVREMFGEDMVAGLDAAAAPNGFAAEAASFAFTNAFADFWTRPGIDRKTRSMITMAMIMGLRAPAEFKNHVRGALNNGCSVEEIEELIYQGIPYLGFPTIAVAIQAAAEVLHERGLSPKRNNPEAR
jgi:4-carboxymuconolactone decarboxylase